MPGSDVDRGWAWVILVACFCGMLINGVVLFSTGVIMAAMLDEIEQDLTKVSWVNSIHTACMCTSGVFAGFITTKYGCRVSTIIGALFNLAGMTGSFFASGVASLIFTYSVLGGAGIGIGTIASMVSCGYYFKKFRAIASGIVASGSGLGMFIGPPVIRILIDVYSIRGAFLIIGGFVFNYAVIGMLMRPSPTEQENFRKSSSKNRVVATSISERNISGSKWKQLKNTFLDFLQVFKNMPFAFYLLSLLIYGGADTAALYHLPNYTEQMGTSKMQSAILFTIMGVTNLSSKLLIGFVATDILVGPQILHFALLGIAGVLTLTFPLYSHTYATQAVFSAGYGMYTGGLVSLMNPIIVALVSVEHLAYGFGCVSLVVGVGSLLGTPIAGMIVEHGGSYTVGYAGAGVALLLSAFVTLPIALREKSRSTLARTYEERSETVATNELEALKPPDPNMDIDCTDTRNDLMIGCEQT